MDSRSSSLGISFDESDDDSLVHQGTPPTFTDSSDNEDVATSDPELIDSDAEVNSSDLETLSDSKSDEDNIKPLKVQSLSKQFKLLQKKPLSPRKRLPKGVSLTLLKLLNNLDVFSKKCKATSKTHD